MVTQDVTSPAAPATPERLDHWRGGAPQSPNSERYRPAVNPIDQSVSVEVAQGDEVDVDLAVRAAQAAYLGWRYQPALERGRLFTDLARAMRADVDRLADLEARETGKPMLVAIAEIHGAANYFEFYGGLTGLPVGETLDIAPGQHVYTKREPYGVIGIITPWNVPINQAARAVAPAMLAGNAVVVKPAETSSSTTVELARMASEVGFPPDVFNVVVGSGRVAGTALVNHPLVRKVAFTGSVETGRTIGRLAAERIIPLTLELGGKSANIVFADADLPRAAAGAVAAYTGNAGQVCSAGTRLLVQRSIHDEFVEHLKTASAKVRAGIEMGPMITGNQFATVQEYFVIAEQEGATPVIGGTVSADPELAKGFYVDPTVYTGVTNDMRIAREEIFGPVLVVIPFDDDAEAVALANDSDFGLVAGLWTRDLSRALTVSDRLEAGQVFVNTWTTGAVQTPFGGWKNSGYGREKGIEAIHHYSQIKCVTIMTDPR